MCYKQFKDPIYGYIKIPSYYVSDIIDSAVFQRLRRITQTSYIPLYPSAVHNRFAHSIGVFHLGNIAGDVILEEINKNNDIISIFEKAKIESKHIIEIFKLACLLHDVGHAPFSHTGERFFLDEEQKYTNLHKKLLEYVNSEQLKEDIPKENSKAAAPHEIISAIIGIKEFGSQFKSDLDKEFFVRCITGYKFSRDSEICSIYNCFISLLNSKVIDVDKLDYLIRDAYFTGFENINIDYVRLLTSITIVEKEDNESGIKYDIAYNKNALSIIENVVYAHDSERKWIQTHPIVLYDMYILQHIMNVLSKDTYDDGKKLFSLEALGFEGISKSTENSISLLCDDDIVHLLKNYKNDELFTEFFSRNTRRHPLWKSEAEYKVYWTLKFGNGGEVIKKIEEAFEETEAYLRKNSDSWIINDDAIAAVQNEITKINNSDIQSVDKRSYDRQLHSKKMILRLMTCMSEYAKNCNCKCDFVILKASQFYSGFNKNEFSKILIKFKDNNKTYEFYKVVPLLSSSDDNNKDFFYLYFKTNKSSNFKREDFCKKIYTTFM